MPSWATANAGPAATATTWWAVVKDLGARELEAVGLLHMAVQGTLGTGFGSALKILS